MGNFMLGQIRWAQPLQFRIKLVKLCSPEVKLGGPKSNPVILSQIRLSWVKSVDTDSVLSQTRSSCIKCGSPRSNQVVLGQISQS